MTLTVLAEQEEISEAFGKWVHVLEQASKPVSFYRQIEGAGIVYGNYGHGANGTITNQIMFGADSEFKYGIVKLVKPDASDPLKKKTAIFRNAAGNILILREGRLQKNRLSRSIISEFEYLSSLEPNYVCETDARKWFLVADLSQSPAEVVKSTVEFVLGCARARNTAGGGSVQQASPVQSYGMDEKGSIYTVTMTGGTKEIEKLQGYVWEALKKKIGSLAKPANGRFCVDGIIANNGALLEIKTGTSADTIYTAIGQLIAYPKLITTIPDDIKKILLIPEIPTINPLLSCALLRIGIEVYTYSVQSSDKKGPKITFSENFINLCQSLKDQCK